MKRLIPILIGGVTGLVVGIAAANPAAGIVTAILVALALGEL